MTEYIYRFSGYGAIGGVLIQQLIRCGQCEHYIPEAHSCNAHDAPYDVLDPNDFCSWGRLKKDHDGGKNV